MRAVCEILDVSRSSFYAWRDETETQREREDREFVPLVCAVFWRHKRRYGARRIAEELKDRGRPCGVARVAKLLKYQGLRAIQPESFKPKTTDSRHTLGYSPNLLSNRAGPTRINEVWVADKQLRPPTDEGGSRPRAVVQSSFEGDRLRLPGVVDGLVLTADRGLEFPGRDGGAAGAGNPDRSDSQPPAGAGIDPPQRPRRAVRRRPVSRRLAPSRHATKHEPCAELL